MQQLEDKNILISKENSYEDSQLFEIDIHRREFNLVSAALLLFYSHSNYCTLAYVKTVTGFYL